MKITLTLEQYIEKVVNINGNRYTFDKTVYTGMKKSIIVTCKKHNHDFSIMAGTLSRKTIRNGGNKKDPIVGSYPMCRVEYFQSLKVKMLQKFKLAHSNEYDYTEDSYVNINTPFYAIC